MLRKLGRFVLPAEVDHRKRRLELMVWSFLLSLAFHPGVLGFLAWFSLVRPLMILSKLEGRKAFGAAYYFAFFFNIFSLYWIAPVTPPGLVGAVLIVSMFYAVMLAAFSRLFRLKPIMGAVAAPMLWVGLEYLRTLTEFAFPWSDLGYTQSYYLYMIQFVSVTSVHGLSFLIVTVNVLLWQALRRELDPNRRVTAVFASMVIVVSLLSYGWIVTPKYPTPGTYDVVLLQGSVPLEDKWDPDNLIYNFELYDSLAHSVADTVTLADSASILYVWPETSAPCYPMYHYPSRRRLITTARETAGYHLVGALGAREINGEMRHFNSCFQINPAGAIDKQYDKVKLVPFSEQVPYQDKLPFMRRDVITKYLTFIETLDVEFWSDFRPGDSASLFELPETKYGVLICFESTFPEYVRSMILKGAGFLVGITNDTWFGTSVGIHQHSRIFYTRAVENRCWAVRVANSGLSYIVDPYGRLHREIPVNAVAAVRDKVGLIEDQSFFTRHGDLVGRFSFLILLGVIVILAAIWLVQKILPRKLS